MPDTAHDRERFLAALPEGKAIGNKALRSQLGWSEERYFTVRNILLDDGLIARGRGKGGSVRRITLGVETEEETAKDVTVGETVLAYAREAELYEPMRQVIERAWAIDHKTEPLAVLVTAAQGKRATGGRWTRPDIVSVAVRTFRYLPGKYLEVVTFEVKPADSWDVTAVYEALAHLRSATHSYVLLHIPHPEAGETPDKLDELVRVARSHGVGVIVAGDGDYDTWEEHSDAVRRDPDPQLLDDFIAVQMPGEVRERISRHLH